MWVKSRSIFMSFLFAYATRGAAGSTLFSAFVRPCLSSTRAVTTSIGLPRQSPWMLSSSQNRNGDATSDDDDDFKPTWTYEPYNPARPAAKRIPSRRPFSTWTVPKSIDIPEDRLEISFVRSSGAGGQNVNKLSTKVDVRFHVGAADWIPAEVRGRLKELQANRINKEGFLSLQSQEYRTQGQNRKAAIAKLQEMLLQAWPRPKVRKQRTGVSKAAKARNKEFKKKRSETKSNRGRVDY
jgi:hypothetical protein